MLKIIIAGILAIISTIGFNINVDKFVPLSESLNGNSVSYIIIAIAFGVLIYKAISIKEKRLSIIAILLSMILSAFAIVGGLIVSYGELSEIAYEKTALFKNMIKFIYYLTTLYSIIKIAFYNTKMIKNNKNVKEYTFFTNNKKSILTVLIIILLCWLPYFLKYFPGIVDFDGREQIKEAVGVSPMLKAASPVLVVFIRMMVNITQPIFHSMTATIAVCVILKMIFIAFAISYGIYYLSKENINPIIRIFVLLFFAFNPIFPLYAISFEKDSLFASMFLIDFILLFDFTNNTDEFVKSKSKILTTFILLVLTIFTRPNGMYLFVLTIPFIYIVLRKKYLKLTAFIVSVFLVVNIVNAIIYSTNQVYPGSIAGNYCAMMQGMSRLVTLNGNNLTEEEKKEIDLYVEYDELPGSYNPQLSDPEMGHFRFEYLKEHKLDYFKLNLKLFLKYPQYYIESLLYNTSGYWYPEKHKPIFNKGMIKNDLGMKEYRLVSNKLLDKIDNLTEKRQIPVIGMLYGPGITLWFLIILVFYVIYRKKSKLLVPLLPFIFNYMIIMIGPSNTEYRYILPMHIAIIFAYVLIINKINIEKS